MAPALWVGAGLAALLGAALIVRAKAPPATPPVPPPPSFGSETPEVLQAIGPYGVQPVSQTA